MIIIIIIISMCVRTVKTGLAMLNYCAYQRNCRWGRLKLDRHLCQNADAAASSTHRLTRAAHGYVESHQTCYSRKVIYTTFRE